MSKELIIRSQDSAIDFALLDEGSLVELHKQEEETNFSVGDILLARVRRYVKGLNATFVNVNYEKDGFLHCQDFGSNIKQMLKFTKGVISKQIRNFDLSDIVLNENNDSEEADASKSVSSNQSILVQVIKEPISTKGPRVSAEISIAGRHLVLVPFSNKVSVSQKIADNEEKDRLVRLVKSIKPKGFGVIIRTIAQNKKVVELDADLKNLYDRWKLMCAKLSKSRPVTTVLRELNKTSSIIRDMFNDEFTAIYVNDESLYNQIREDIAKVNSSKEGIVKYFKESSLPIFEKFGIERQIKSSFGQIVNMSKGAYLVIEHTEALHVIDVNSGGRSNKLNNQQDTALEVNLIAAKEISRQLRLRDMGGIIVVDFIDMNTSKARRELYEYLKDCMKEDKAKHKILPPSKFGLIQITRQRVRSERKITTEETLPSITQTTIAPILIIDKLTFQIETIIENKKGNKGIVLNLHPFVAAYLTKGLFSIQFKWFLKFRKRIKIIPRDAYTYLEYSFKNSKGENIKL